MGRLEASLAYTFRAGDGTLFRIRSSRVLADGTVRLDGEVRTDDVRTATFHVLLNFSLRSEALATFEGKVRPQAEDEYLAFTEWWCAAEGLRRTLNHAPQPEVEAHPQGEVKADDIPPEAMQAAQNAARLQARWEATLVRLFTRHWERRRRVILQKISSVQFRRGTPLWDPPGDKPYPLDVLIDLDQWDRELTEDLEDLLPDLFQEAVAALDIVEMKADVDMGGFVRRWILHALGFNRSVAESVRQVLNAGWTRTPEIEEAVEREGARTAELVGNRVATSIATGGTNEAQLQAAGQLPGTVKKLWYSALDNRVRPAHRAASGDRVDLDEPFVLRARSGVLAEMMHPGDVRAPMDLWVNCRCVMLFVTAMSSQVWDIGGTGVDRFGRASGVVASQP